MNESYGLQTSHAKRPPTRPIETSSTGVFGSNDDSVLAMAIVSLSYSAALAGTPAFFQLQLIVIMWGIMVSFEALCVTLVFRWFIRGGDCASFCSKELPKGVAEPVVSDSMGNDNVSKTQAGIEGGAIKALEVESVAE